MTTANPPRSLYAPRPTESDSGHLCPESSPSLLALMQAAGLAGDAHDEEDAYKLLFRRVWSICRSMRAMRPGLETEDVVQDTVYVVYRYVVQGRVRSNLKALINSVARARITDFLRRNGHPVNRRQHDAVLEELPCPSYDLRERVEAVLDAVEALPAIQREVIESRLRGETKEVIAARLGYTLYRVIHLDRSAIERIRATLRIGNFS